MSTPHGATDHVQLLRVMAWSIADDSPAERRGPVALEDLDKLLTTLPAESWQPVAADVLVCWALCRRVPSETIITAAESGASAGGATVETAANAWAVGALAARFRSASPARPTLRPPADLDWEAVGDWYARAASMAIPGLTDFLVGDHAEALLRAVAQALLADDLIRAGKLLRWLALAPTSVDRLAGDALDATLARTRTAASRAFPVLVAYQLWRARADEQRPADSVPPSAAPQPSAGQDALIEPTLRWLLAQPMVTADAGPAELRRFGELAVLGDQLQRKADERGQPTWRETGRELLTQAWAALGEGEVLARLVEANPSASTAVTIYWPFHRNGFRNPRFERLVAAGAPAIGRSLAYLAAVAMRAVGLTPPWSLDEAFSWSVVGAARPPWRLSLNEPYLITHIAMYDAVEGHQRGREYLARWLPVWLRHYEAIGWNDMLAEMICVWHCVETACCPPRAWRTLLSAQRSDGSVPFWRPGVGADYHSTLVTLMAALFCRHGRHGRHDQHE